MMQADLLENISETKYLSADNYTVYRTVMRIFYLEHQKMHYQMDRDAVLGLLRQQSLFAQYSPEQLAIDLQQLVKWKNLIPIQDPRKPRTIAEFKNRQFQYMMSQPAIEIERMTITLENLSSRTAAPLRQPVRRIREDLYRAEQLDGLSLREVQDWWEDLQEDFQRLSQSHQDYLREFYGPGMEMQMKAVEFITYKQNLVRYLEEFIQDLQHSVAQIGAQLERFSPKRRPTSWSWSGAARWRSRGPSRSRRPDGRRSCSPAARGSGAPCWTGSPGAIPRPARCSTSQTRSSDGQCRTPHCWYRWKTWA